MKETNKKLKTTKDLGKVVNVMKSFSAQIFHQNKAAIQSIQKYEQTIYKGFSALFSTIEFYSKKNQQEEKKVCFILVGSEKGLCGKFNEKIVNFFNENEKKIPYIEKEILLFGQKLFSLISYPNKKKFHSPKNLTEIESDLEKLIILIQDLIKEQKINEIYLFFHKTKDNYSYEPTKEKLYPLDFNLFKKTWKGRTIPQYKSSQEDLLSSLIHYYLYAKIYKAFIESLTTENSHRLIAMDRAEKNIKEMKESLEKKILQKRQEEITSELLDIVTGYLSLS